MMEDKDLQKMAKEIAFPLFIAIVLLLVLIFGKDPC
jgi:hypothetical protein